MKVWDDDQATRTLTHNIHQNHADWSNDDRHTNSQHLHQIQDNFILFDNIDYVNKLFTSLQNSIPHIFDAHLTQYDRHNTQTLALPSLAKIALFVSVMLDQKIVS
jgi:hypothetical protein